MPSWEVGNTMTISASSCLMPAVKSMKWWHLGKRYTLYSNTVMKPLFNLFFKYISVVSICLQLVSSNGDLSNDAGGFPIEVTEIENMGNTVDKDRLGDKMLHTQSRKLC